MNHNTGREKAAAAVNQLRDRHPDTDVVLVMYAVVDAQAGLTLFGFSEDEQSVTLIMDVASRDPRLRVNGGARRAGGGSFARDRVEQRERNKLAAGSHPRRPHRGLGMKTPAAYGKMMRNAMDNDSCEDRD